MVQEIEERKRFLDEMTALGKRREYQQLIKNEIADVCSSKNVDVFSFHCFRFV